MFVSDTDSCPEPAETARTSGPNGASKPIISGETRVLSQELSKAGRPGEVASQKLAAMGAVVVPLLIDVLGSGNRVARENAARALGRIGAAAKDAIPALTKALQADHPWVQKAAGKALAKIESAAETPSRAIAHQAEEAAPTGARGRQPLWGCSSSATDKYLVRRIEQAVARYQQALQLFVREAFPLEWASIHNTIGEAYRSRSLLGERVENLDQAILHYQQALEVVTSQNYPELWAAVHNNLGIAYGSGARGDRAENLERAIHHCQQALEVYTREAYPDDWAMTQNNLGQAYRKRVLGERADNIKSAILHYKQALEVQIHQTNREQWAGTHHNLSLAYWDRPDGEQADNIEQVIHHCQQASQVYTRAAYPRDWAATHCRLGTAYSARILGDRAQNLDQAIQHFQQALEVFTRDRHPEAWAKLQQELAIAYRERTFSDKSLEEGLQDSRMLLTYPQFYDEEAQRQPGRRCKLKLARAIIPDFPYFTQLVLIYQWDGALPDAEAKRLALRAVAYIVCAIYDAATISGLSCQPSEIANGRRPAWYVEGEKVPVSLTLSDVDILDRTCQMTIGAVITAIGSPPSSRSHWEKLQAGFQDRFSEISV